MFSSFCIVSQCLQCESAFSVTEIVKSSRRFVASSISCIVLWQLMERENTYLHLPDLFAPLRLTTQCASAMDGPKHLALLDFVIILV